ncbi:MAG: glycoside hydrolase family 13 protein [Prolixibacteraceae bacterium]|jgi:glycosidase|nr:glycoside hydrolase family 13 protein [Prolixibacteraceae bacterium]
MKSMFSLKSALLMLCFLLSSNIQAAPKLKPMLERVEPAFWWVGFKNHNLQLLVHGEQISLTRPVVNYQGVALESVVTVENPNYLFLNLKIDANTLPGKFNIDFALNGKVVQTFPYELKAREAGSANRIGFNSSDVLYLIMPDRFANGDPSNDSKPEMADKLNRSEQYGRHGGDIKGMLDHLDYVADQGYTALWLNPVLENDMPQASYHGYATTDFYRVDRRYGSNEDYRQLADAAKKKGIKMIMDMIFNHCGTGHWWMKDLPSKDWLNADAKTITNHRKSVQQDPYGAQCDKDEFHDGWFVPSMPDLNQKNPLMARYLIQNSIWWIEYVGLSGIRMDTYPYPFPEMMAEWTREVMVEYPDFNIVGEEWNTNQVQVAYWQNGKVNPDGYRPYLRSLMDFPLQDGIVKAFSEKEGWSEGLNRLYDVLALDFLYPNPKDLVVFADNHDTERFFTAIHEDFSKFKMAMAYLMTIRGTPQIYYGSDILMTGRKSDGDGMLRKDFPGGWAGDKVNGFTGEGLTAQQKEAQQYLKKLITWRKGKEVIHTGKMLHYLVKEGVYAFFRYNDRENIMVIFNNSTEEKPFKSNHYREGLKGSNKGYEVISGKPVDDLAALKIPAHTAMIVELK